MCIWESGRVRVIQNSDVIEIVTLGEVSENPGRSDFRGRGGFVLARRAGLDDLSPKAIEGDPLRSGVSRESPLSSDSPKRPTLQNIRPTCALWHEAHRQTWRRSSFLSFGRRRFLASWPRARVRMRTGSGPSTSTFSRASAMEAPTVVQIRASSMSGQHSDCPLRRTSGRSRSTPPSTLSGCAVGLAPKSPPNVGVPQASEKAAHMPKAPRRHPKTRQPTFRLGESSRLVKRLDRLRCSQG